jgi:hypothetical protein
MAKKPKHHQHEHHHEHEHEHEHEREHGGDSPRKHAEIIERRWLRSPRPTHERYARAIQQWHALPGAVLRPATDVTVASKTPAHAHAKRRP